MKLKEYMSNKKLIEESNKLFKIKITKRRSKNGSSKNKAKNHDHDSQRN